MCGFKKQHLLLCFYWMLTVCNCIIVSDDLTICYAGYRNAIIPERRYCDRIQILSKDRVRCVYATDRLRCLEQLLEGNVDLGVFKPEDLFLASQLNSRNGSENLVITNEFRLFSKQKHEFDMVTLVSNNPNVEINSLADLRSKKLCHPGFDEHDWSNDLTDMFFQYFEEVVVPAQCDPDLSVLENKVKSSNSFFSSSCVPGPWSPETNIDKKLKLRYNRLCEMCGDPSECSHNDLYWGPQGAVTCMLDCRGDVTWAKLQILEYNLRKNSPCQDVSYLCLDGTKQPINTTDPCVWISRPWPVIVTHKAVQKRVSALIDFINNSSLNEYSWEYAVRSVLGNSLQPIHSINPISPLEYLSAIPGFLDASKKLTCRGSGQDMVVKICVENDKIMEKCSLMAKVANFYSIDPQFECVVGKCLETVSEGNADILITSIENLTAVYERKNLKVIMYQTTEDYSELRHSSAIVRNSSAIHSLSDLKGKKACFTRYNGLGWNSLLMALNESFSFTDICNGTKVIKEFFSDVCVIDHQSTDPVRSCFDSTDSDTPTGSLHINEAEGLRCLVEGGGDVTFIDQNYIAKYLQENKNLPWANSAEAKDRNHFRSVCSSKSVSDPDCFLSVATFGMVVVRDNMSTDREQEIISAFSILSSLLGEKPTFNRNNNYEPKIFRLFTHYYNERNVLFESSAGRLETTDQYFTRGRIFVKNFYEVKLQNLLRTCAEKEQHENNVATLIAISNAVILCLFVVHLIT